MIRFHFYYFLHSVYILYIGKQCKNGNKIEILLINIIPIIYKKEVLRMNQYLYIVTMVIGDMKHCTICGVSTSMDKAINIIKEVVPKGHRLKLATDTGRCMMLVSQTNPKVYFNIRQHEPHIFEKFDKYAYLVVKDNNSLYYLLPSRDNLEQILRLDLKKCTFETDINHKCGIEIIKIYNESNDLESEYTIYKRRIS